MANWSDLKAAVASIVKTNGNKEITGQLLQNVLNNIISNVGLNSSFAGIATPETNPGTPDGNVFYLATTEGTYSNFNGIVINPGEAVILEWKGSWVKKDSGFATKEKLSELGSELGSELRKSINNETIRAKEAEEELENNINSNRYGYNVTVNGLKGGIHTIETAIKDVPYKFRMLGQKITFRTENGDWATYHNESLSLDNYENVNDWVQEVGISSVQGDINISNNPDYEDLTEAADGTIKFADKEYSAEVFSGLGRVYLRKNIVDGVNVLTQGMMSKPNTIYIIQYDYDLQGAEIAIPEGCVLDFQGGSLSNGTIEGNKTLIRSLIVEIFDRVEFSGSFNIPVVYSNWFKHEYNYPFDDIFKSLVILGHNGRIELAKETYIIASEILMSDVNVKIEGNGAKFVKDNDGARFKIVNNDKYDFYLNNLNFDGLKYKGHLFAILNFENVFISHCTFKNMADMNDEENTIADGMYVQNVENAIVQHCIIDNCRRDGIYFGCAKHLTVEYCTISNCGRYGIVNDGSQGDRPVLRVDYNNNLIRNCDGGLHCESKLDETYEPGVANIYCNTILECGFSGSTYIGGIIVGNNINANIFNNNITDHDIVNGKMYAISFSNPTSINVTNNSLINVATGINFSQDTKKPQIVNIEGNSILSNARAISVYGCSANVSVISNNSISVKNGGGISVNLSSRAFITNNTIRSLINSATENNIAIRIIYTPTLSIVGNVCFGNFYNDLAVWADKTNGTIGHIYVRNYTLHNNNFRSNNLFNVQFEVKNEKIHFINKPNSVDGFALKLGDSYISNNMTLYYYNGNEWTTYPIVPHGTYDNIKFSLPKGAMYFAKDLETRGNAGTILVSTGNYSFNDIFGGFYSLDSITKYKGSSSEREINTSKGFEFFDTDQGRPIWKNSEKGENSYIDALGNPADAKTKGTFDEKYWNAKVGFAYYCTDRRAPENEKDGLVIYHIGNNAWVDALGRVVV